MLKTALAAVVLAATASTANAADLPRGSIGQIFAEPAGRPVAVYREDPYAAQIAPWVNNSPWVPGYYGRPGNFYYQSYYGTPFTSIYNRLPYACKYYGSC